jgi:hypothetical protein
MTQAGWLERMIRQAAKRRKLSLPAGESEPKGTRRQPTAPGVGAELAGSDPWQAAAVAANEYYETDPEAVEWAMFAGDTLDDAGRNLARDLRSHAGGGDPEDAPGGHREP